MDATTSSNAREHGSAPVDGRYSTEYTSLTMRPLKAHVKNGRLVLDEPTDLPEGEVIELVPLDEVLAKGGDYLDDEERAALHAELEASIAEVKAGEVVPAEVVIAELRAMRR